jgi:hypothetical protein
VEMEAVFIEKEQLVRKVFKFLIQETQGQYD